MKKVIFKILFLLPVIIFFSCTNSNKPELIAERFVNLVLEKKYDEAKKLGTENTIKMIDMLENISKLNKDSEVDNDSRPENFQVLIKNDSIAVVSYFQKGAENKLDMVYRSGKWYIDMKKEPGFDDEDPNNSNIDIDTSHVKIPFDSIPND